MSEELTNLVYIYCRMLHVLLPNIFTCFKGRPGNNSDYICSWLVLKPCKVYKSVYVCEGDYEEVFGQQIYIFFIAVKYEVCD